MLGLRVPGVSNLLQVHINLRAFAAKSRFLRMAITRGFSAAVFDMIVNKRRAGTSLQQTSYSFVVIKDQTLALSADVLELDDFHLTVLAT